MGKNIMYGNDSPHRNPAPEIIQVPDDADQVSCDGGGGALGHPVVWYSFDDSTCVTCGYCDRVFTKKIN
ncbi:MAG: zinc-finger domain-containing protein [Alphaproteobacteria bacterium]